MQSLEAKKMFKKYEEMLALLGEYEVTIYAEWIAGVSEACSFNLQQPLLTRNEETKLIAVNFDPQVNRHKSTNGPWKFSIQRTTEFMNVWLTIGLMSDRFLFPVDCCASRGTLPGAKRTRGDSC